MAMVFMIIADGEPDQTVESQEVAKREAGELRRQGFKVVIKPFPSWQASYDYEDKLRAVA